MFASFDVTSARRNCVREKVSCRLAEILAFRYPNKQCEFKQDVFTTVRDPFLV